MARNDDVGRVSDWRGGTAHVAEYHHRHQNRDGVQVHHFAQPGTILLTILSNAQALSLHYPLQIGFGCINYFLSFAELSRSSLVLFWYLLGYQKRASSSV